VGHRRNREEIKRFLEVNENANTTYQNLWDIKSSPRGKFIGMSAYIKRTNTRTKRRREIIKIRAKNNDIEYKKKNQRIDIKN
jgi:hypothetical protein